MKIKLSTIYASPDLTANPGDIIEVKDEAGNQLVAGLFGTEVSAATPVTPVIAPGSDNEIDDEETAADEPPENAMRKPGGRAIRIRASASDKKE